MIAVLGSPTEEMVSRLYEALEACGARVVLLSVHDVPGTIRLGVAAAPRGEGFFRLEDGRRIPFSALKAVYQRVGFHDTEVFEEYSAEEARFAKQECQVALNAILNGLPGLVVNRPSAAGSNASKPYQIGLIAQHGLLVPDTVVTNEAAVARDFYERLAGNVIYKSVSYVRSIVQVMKREDLGRLGTLRNCPIQLQERIEGFDIRVHVVGERTFSCAMRTGQSDYRYDRALQVTTCSLPADVEQKCVSLARALGLTLAGIDLRQTDDGRFYCFEVNPSPAFIWYEERSGLPITQAVADVLCEADT